MVCPANALQREVCGMKPAYRLQQPMEMVSDEILSPEDVKKQERLAKNRATASVSR